VAEVALRCEELLVVDLARRLAGLLAVSGDPRHCSMGRHPEGRERARGLTKGFLHGKLSSMTVVRQVRKVGGSLAVLIPRDLAESMHVREGSDVRLTLVGGQLVVEPTREDMPEPVFRRAMAAVLRRDATLFKKLADYDAGK
jgi:antitoxin component of MazEF toxin-antitoxin module